MSPKSSASDKTRLLVEHANRFFTILAFWALRRLIIRAQSTLPGSRRRTQMFACFDCSVGARCRTQGTEELCNASLRVGPCALR